MAVLFKGKQDVPGREFYEVPDTVMSDDDRVYEIADRIAAGGNGVVHKCTEAATGDEYAIKFQLDLHPDRLRRFSRERQLLADLRHDHLILYEDTGSVNGRLKRKNQQHSASVKLPFLIMELARSSLFEHLKAESAIPPEIYLAQFRGLARALGLLHGKAVHRDIKPENILVVGDRWVLSDYGLCDLLGLDGKERLTPDWMIVGPRYWMSPEANNRTIGNTDAIVAASDVFQLASVFWLVVNRRHPTGVLTRTDWSGPEPLFGPIFKALHYNVTMRPADGNLFAAEIENAILS